MGGILMRDSAVTSKCPNCGGDLVWNAESQLFLCSWCSSDFPEEDIRAGVEDIIESEQYKELQEKFAEDTLVYICESCGAEIICEKNTAATYCCFCHNPVALKGRLSGNYRPEMIIPFKLSKRQALSIFKANCMKKWFLPFDFLSNHQLEKMTGLYVPFWLADCEVDANLMADASETVTKKYNSESVTETHYYTLDRAAKMTYMGIPADGSKQISDKLMDAIEPYDYRMLRGFDMSYLSGYYCDKFDVEKYEVIPRIKERISVGAIDALERDILRFETRTIKRKSARMYGMKWHYVMMPVWFISYKHNGQLYNIAINGQTGRVAGNFPFSALKIIGAGLFIAIATGLVAYFSVAGFRGGSDIPSLLFALFTSIAAAAGSVRGILTSYEEPEEPQVNNYLDLRQYEIYRSVNNHVRTVTRESHFNDPKEFNVDIMKYDRW